MSLARNTDPTTSRDAAASVEGQLNTIQRDVLDAFKKHGSMTDAQLNKLFDDNGHNYAESTVRKRRSELTQLGLIKGTGERVGRHEVYELA